MMQTDYGAFGKPAAPASATLVARVERAKTPKTRCAMGGASHAEPARNAPISIDGLSRALEGFARAVDTDRAPPRVKGRAIVTGKRPEPIKALFSGEDVRNFHEIVRQVPIIHMFSNGGAL